MSRISGSSPQQLQRAIKSSLADKNLDKNEMQQLQQLVQNTPGLSEETKAGVMKFLDQARSDSKGWFFGLFGRGISDHEMGALQNLAQSESQNPVLQGLVQSLREARAAHQNVSPQQTGNAAQNNQNNVNAHQNSWFDPIARLFQHHPAPEAATSSNNSVSANQSYQCSANFSDFYVTQNGNRLASGAGDCGPACAAMVAKRFGFINQNCSSRDAVLKARQACGVTSSRNGAWAISESEVAKAVRNMSGGQVRQTGNESFRSSQSQSFIQSLRNHLSQGDMPIIEIGSPYNSHGGRHYMVAMEVKPNGNIVVADPGGKHQWEITPQKLAEEMRQADAKGGSHILAFNR